MLMLTQALLLATAAATTEVTCTDEFDSTHLSEAIDAAMMELQGTKGWFGKLKVATSSPDYMTVFSCTPGDKWVYPKAEDATGLLKRVLQTGELKVGGAVWGPYKDDPCEGSEPCIATGQLDVPSFWVQYMNEIVQTLNAHYKAEIKLVRYYWATIGGVSGSVAVNFAVADGTVDVSEPYYKLGGFHDNTPRIESLAFSCVTAGTESIFYTRADSNITDTNSLFAAIKTGPLKAVGFIGEGNYNTVSHLLPDEVSPQYQTISDMEANVLNDALIAGHNAENMPPNPAFQFFQAGLVEPRVALFRKPNPTCTADEAAVDARVAAAAKAAKDAAELAAAKKDDDDDLNVGLVVTLAVLAVALLLTVSVVVHLIRMEKKGSPLFMPLMNERGVEAVAVGTKGPDANAV